MIPKDKGLLESLNIKIEKSAGETLKRTIEATKAVLDSVGAPIVDKKMLND